MRLGGPLGALRARLCIEWRALHSLLTALCLHIGQLALKALLIGLKVDDDVARAKCPTG